MSTRRPFPIPATCGRKGLSLGGLLVANQGLTVRCVIYGKHVHISEPSGDFNPRSANFAAFWGDAHIAPWFEFPAWDDCHYGSRQLTG
jgi:hypothetical protein